MLEFYDNPVNLERKVLIFSDKALFGWGARGGGQVTHMYIIHCADFVQFLFFKIGGYILRNQKFLIGLDFLDHHLFILLFISIFFWYCSFFKSTAYSKLRNISMFFSRAFVQRICQGHWCCLSSRNFDVWPMFLLVEMFSVREGTLINFIFSTREPYLFG